MRRSREGRDSQRRDQSSRVRRGRCGRGGDDGDMDLIRFGLPSENMVPVFGAGEHFRFLGKS